VKNATAARRVSRAGTLDTSEAVAMGIDAEGLVVVMNMLSKLYTNPSAAVVREYACNAYDSHVEAGVQRPIEVTLPTPLVANLKIKDYGVGLSRDGIMGVYAQYGASTKRDSNTQIGAFGIGSKSAFAVGNQFTVTAVKDGEKTIALFVLDGRGVPTVQILYHGDTDEPNGVEIDVAVEHPQAVATAATDLFRHWKPGTVLVDGEQPKSLFETADELALGIYIDPEGRSISGETFRLVMGGVPYFVPGALWNELSPTARTFCATALRTKVSYILDVPIGAVDIAPNREDLQITPRTRATFGRMVELAANSVGPWMTKKVDSAANLWEASRTYVRLSNQMQWHVSSANVYWHGTSLGHDHLLFQYPTFRLKTNRSSRYSRMTGQYMAVETVESFPEHAVTIDSTFNKTLWVTEVPDDKVNIVRTYAKLFLKGDYDRIVASPLKSEVKNWFSYGKGSLTGVPTISFIDYHEQGKAIRRANRASNPRPKTKYNTMVDSDQGGWVERDVDEIEELMEGMTSPKVLTGRVNRGNSAIRKILQENEVILIDFKTNQKVERLAKLLDVQIDNAHSFVRDEAAKLIALSQHDVDLLKAHRIRSDATDTVKFVAKHRARITNKAILEVADEYAAIKLSPADEARIREVESIYLAAGKSLPFPDEGKGLAVKIDKTNPLLRVVLRNVYLSTTTLGGEDKMVEALIDYINNVSVASV
jgi:hypothetical protein